MELREEHFQYLEKSSREVDVIRRPSVSFWADAWRRFKKNKLAMTGLVLLTALLSMAFIGPLLTPYDYLTTHPENSNQPPSAAHWFGTDELGRDMFERVWFGARISLFIGVMAATVDLIIGVLWGGIAGYFGRKTDEVMMRIADILWAIPYLLMVILFTVVFGQNLFNMILAMSVIGWINMSRIVRGQILQLKSQEYVMAARSLGAGTGRILFKHLIPNTMGPIIVTMTLTIPTAIFTEAFLSYLGLGVKPPMASWGTMANDGLSAMSYFPWRLFFPAFFICLTMFAFNVIGDGLRDAFDPRMRK